MTGDDTRGALYGLIVTLSFVLVDAAVGNEAAISGAYGLGAIVAGVLAGFRPAATIGAVAVVLAAASPIWNGDFGTSGYFLRLIVAVAASFLGLGAGRLRDATDAQLAQQSLLAAVAEYPVAGATLQQTAVGLADLLVPRYAGYAVLDGGMGGRPVHLAARGTEPAEPSATIEARLRARGRDIGSLTIAQGRSGVEDAEFLRVLAGRVALALDNAGLSQELTTVEQQLQAILENLGEAITVQDQSGRLVFANKAAAELLEADSVEALLTTPPLELAARFTSVTEDGEPLDLARVPGREVLAGRSADPLLVRVRNNQTGEERWRLTKATPVHGPDGDVLLAVNIIEDVTETKRSEMAQRLLSDASAALASSLDYLRTLQKVADLAVPDFADWCVVSLPDGDMLRQVAVAHRDPNMRGLVREHGERWPRRISDDVPTAEVFRTGEPRLIPHITREMLGSMPGGDEQLALLDELDLHSVIVVPMATPERTVGVLSLISTASHRTFIGADLDLALELGRRAATAVENARLYSELEHVATTLQRSLLPPSLPDVPGWKFESLYLPAGGETDVSGDFYDVFPTGAGWMAVMGDVVGRGPAAASLTAMGRYTLRTAASLVGAPTMGLARLNANLRERDEMALCTVAVVQMLADADEASVVCAGHPLPLLVRDGRPHPVGRTGPLLGAFEDGQWRPVSVPLQSGDLLVLYTDGVLDARADSERFGEERLARALAGASSAEDAVDRVRDALQEFSGTEQDDDTAVLAMQKL